MTIGGPALDTLTRLLRADPAASPGIAAVPEARWAAVIALANRHLMGPALHAALARSGVDDAVPEEPRHYLALLHRLNRRRNAIILGQLRELVRALNEAGLEPMLLKGVLALAAQPRPGLGRGARMMADIDFAVPVSAAGPALATLDRLGYRLRERYPEGHHAYGEFAREGDPAAIDPHFELIDQDDVLPAAGVRARARSVVRDGMRFLAPAPSDRLLHTLLHAQIHHRGNFYRGTVELRQLHEFAALAAAEGPRIDWPVVRRRMAAYRLLTPLESYLLLAGRLFGTPWPGGDGPTAAARLHAGRCLLQLRCPALQRLATPPGNLRARFAWHRMRRLYRDRGGGPLAWRWHHLRHVVTRHGAVFVVDRLFRA